MKKLYVVGIGAGNYDGMTVGAVKALEAADVIVGYTVYCDLVKPYFADKEYISTPMMKEIERCRMALEAAQSDKLTAMICSGDAGIYGMASPILEFAGEYGVEVEIIAGVTAASSGAAMSDICVVIYNPSSKKRADHLRKCCEILLKYRSPDTVCGIAQNIGRDGENAKLLTLGELAEYPADMFTTIFIGNSVTKIINGRMVMPRGYRNV